MKRSRLLKRPKQCDRVQRGRRVDQQIVLSSCGPSRGFAVLCDDTSRAVALQDPNFPSIKLTVCDDYDVMKNTGRIVDVARRQRPAHASSFDT